MENTPQYTERERGVRCVAYPKVDDILINRHLGVSMRVVSVDMNKYEFVTEYTGGELVTWDVYDPAWVFVDPAVEAQRLLEAAYRADTSEFPEWIEGAIRFCKADNMKLTLTNLAWCAVQGNCENMEQATRFLVNELPCLLRWQAQQEGGAHE